MHVAEHFQKHFLNHIRRIAGIVRQTADQVKDRVLEARNQGLIGSFLAVDETGD